MPLEIGWAFTVEWTAGDAMCRIMMFFRTFGLYLSSFILVCISLDRFVGYSDYFIKLNIAVIRINTRIFGSKDFIRTFHVFEFFSSYK